MKSSKRITEISRNAFTLILIKPKPNSINLYNPIPKPIQ